jgi:ATP-binding cassette subfamily F protein uup
VFEDDGQIRRHAGGYSDWLERHRSLAVTDTPVATKTGSTRDDRDKPAPRKLSYKLQRELEALPAQIAEIEARVTQLRTLVNDPTLYQRASTEARDRLAELEDAERQLEAAFERWAELEQLAARVAVPDTSAEG